MLEFENIFYRYFRFLNSRTAVFNTLLGLAWVALFGALDTFVPVKIDFSFLYLLPVAFVTWFAGRGNGFIISLICASLWSVDNFVENDLIVSIWNIFSTASIFIAVSAMLSKIHQLWKNDIALSRTDPLTGVMNTRAFSELVDYEILRLQREGSPFSLAYLDVDNFKAVNDRHGHKMGDELLKAVVSNMLGNLRKTDVIARMGGDEFAIFLPATSHEAVQVVMRKVKEELRALTADHNWPTTFSIGVVTCNHGACELDGIITLADELMYEVKNTGKNNIRFGVFAKPDQS